jgi:hypothetical protein
VGDRAQADYAASPFLDVLYFSITGRARMQPTSTRVPRDHRAARELAPFVVSRDRSVREEEVMARLGDTHPQHLDPWDRGLHEANSRSVLSKLRMERYDRGLPLISRFVETQMRTRIAESPVSGWDYDELLAEYLAAPPYKVAPVPLPEPAAPVVRKSALRRLFEWRHEKPPLKSTWVTMAPPRLSPSVAALDPEIPVVAWNPVVELHATTLTPTPTGKRGIYIAGKDERPSSWRRGLLGRLFHVGDDESQSGQSLVEYALILVAVAAILWGCWEILKGVGPDVVATVIHTTFSGWADWTLSGTMP